MGEAGRRRAFAMGTARDAAVRATNDDAAASKASAAAQGYLRDPYVARLLAGGRAEAAAAAAAACRGGAPPPRPVRRRPPMINRGTHARVAAVRRVLDGFLRATAAHGGGVRRQVVSLGAGYDTSALLLAEAAGGAPPRALAYFELDFHEVAARKAAALAAAPDMMDLLGAGCADDVVQPAEGVLRTRAYALAPWDLRAPTAALSARLVELGFDARAPTLVLCECVLSYLDPEHGQALVEWAASLELGALALYEAVRPDDAFGRQMAKHLAERGCPLRGVAAAPDAKAHEARLVRAGFSRASALDMYALYTRSDGVDRADAARAARIEPLDEIEEWRMLMEHYAFATAVSARAADELGLDAQILFGAVPEGPTPCALSGWLPRAD